jgi:cytochrome c-type biogenesis protein
MLKMIEHAFSTLNQWLYESYAIAIIASFCWGILSILLSPCHLSSIPLIVGFISSQGKISPGRTFNISFLFALGILITIGLIGLVTASLGRLMGDIGATGNYIVAIIFFLVGLYLLDIIKFDWNTRLLNKNNLSGLISALVLGLIFGIALGPCTFAFMAPVLGIVFQASQTNFMSSIGLLTAFGIGHCFVIVGAGVSINKLQNYLNWSLNSGIISLIKKVCGILVITGGIYFIYTAK